jgi:hypothetical protein
MIPGSGDVVLDPKKTWEEIGAKDGFVVQVHIPGRYKSAAAA